jgi:hypothetical protein
MTDYKKIDEIIAKTDSLIAETNDLFKASRNTKARAKRNEIKATSIEGILDAFDCGASLPELYSEYSQYTQKAIRKLVEDYQAALKKGAEL